MTFFDEVQPVVQWQERRVHVQKDGKRLELPVEKFESKSMHVVVKTWPSTSLQCENAFDVLTVEEVGEQLLPDDDVSVSVVAPNQSCADVAAVAADVAAVNVVGGQGQCFLGTQMP